MIFLSNLNNSKHLLVDLDMKRLSATILPVSVCIALIELGGCISIIVLIFSGFTFIPFWDTINLKNLPVVNPNIHFLGLSFTPNFHNMSKFFYLFTFHHYIINIGFQIVVNLFGKHLVNCSLKYCSYILKPK